MEKLREVYYPDPTNVRAIESENIDILSDMIFNDGVLKAVVLQAKANNGGIDESAHRGTFLFRLSFGSIENVDCRKVPLFPLKRNFFPPFE